MAILRENGSTRKANKLCLVEEGLDGFVVIAELTTMTLVEDEDNALVFQSFKP